MLSGFFFGPEILNQRNLFYLENIMNLYLDKAKGWNFMISRADRLFLA
jgi:hypothetical protein